MKGPTASLALALVLALIPAVPAAATEPCMPPGYTQINFELYMTYRDRIQCLFGQLDDNERKLKECQPKSDGCRELEARRLEIAAAARETIDAAEKNVAASPVSSDKKAARKTVLEGFRTSLDTRAVIGDNQEKSKTVAEETGQTPEKKIEDAKEKEQEAADKGVKNPAAYRDISKSYREGGYHKDAERLLDKSLALAPDDSGALAERARVRMERRRPEEALADAERALAIDPENKLARQVAGYIQSSLRTGRKVDLTRPDLGRSADSGGIRETTSPKTPEPAPPSPSPAPGATPAQRLSQEAWRKLRLGDLEGALLDATRAIQAEPKNPYPRALRAAVSNKLKNYPAAIQDADEALKSDPDNAAALRERAFAQYQLGNFKEAYADADRAVRLEPGNALGLLYRAMAAEKLGRAAEALADYRAAAALDPSLSPILDSALKRLGGRQEAPPPPPSAPDLRLWGFRAGVGLISGALILLGLSAARRITRRRPAPILAAAPPSETGGHRPMGTLPPGTALGRSFRVVRELGRGGMGVVYEAFDETLQRRVAIKQLRRDLHTTQDDLDLFLREARLVAKLKHPHIVEIHSVVDENELYLVFDYVEGKNLAQVLAERGKLPPPAAAQLLDQICRAVDWAHQQKVVHRDLKPSNVMVAADGSVKVMDFGIAHQSKTAAQQTLTSASGTPPYMAPEQELGAASRESDLYSLGVMAYELVTGSLPFPGPDFRGQKLRAEFTPPSKKDPSLPAGLDAFFQTALEAEPKNRFPSAPALAKAFGESARTPAA